MIKFGAPSIALMGRSNTLNSIKESIPLHKVSFKDFDFTPESGYVYVISRAISSRVNANYDGWPVAVLKEGYKTFNGRPIYVEHNNQDPERARGVILSSIYKESKLSSGLVDASVYCLMEVDAKSFPKLAKAIMEHKINGVSMGADVGFTICSACDNKASKPSEYCSHIPTLKGRKVVIYKGASRKEVTVWENCHTANFFELSFVADPADESAHILDRMEVE